MIIEGINQFSFGGRRSYDDMGLIITEPPVFTFPERDISYIGIPGKSGDLIRDNGRYKNISGSYKVAVVRDEFPLETMMTGIRSWLVGNIGYSVLTDTYDPLYYRMAQSDGKLSFTEILRQIGTGTVKFNCKPYKYRIDGRHVITLAEAGAVFNPEHAESAPYIKITGSGNITLTVNHASFPFTDIDGYIEIDSDIMAVYKGTLLQNEKANFTEFPKFGEGENNVSVQGSVSKIEIIPRWCAL